MSIFFFQRSKRIPLKLTFGPQVVPFHYISLQLSLTARDLHMMVYITFKTFKPFKFLISCITFVTLVSLQFLFSCITFDLLKPFNLWLLKSITLEPFIPSKDYLITLFTSCVLNFMIFSFFFSNVFSLNKTIY